MMAASLGASVVLFDPQPGCGRWIRSEIEANGFGKRAHLVPAALATGIPGQSDTLNLGNPRISCAGGFSIAGRMQEQQQEEEQEISQAIEHKADNHYAPIVSFWHGNRTWWMPRVLHRVLHNGGGFHGRAPTQPLSGQVDPSDSSADPPDVPVAVQLVKVDVEGAELGVIEHNVEPLLRLRLVEHLVVEFGPSRWKAFNRTLRDGVQAVQRIAEYGYSVHTMGGLGKLVQPHRLNTSAIELHVFLQSLQGGHTADLHFQRE
jgi:hypothetical protein